MGTSSIQGDLWGQASRDWGLLQEPLHAPLWETMMEEAKVGVGTRFLDAGCGGGGASLRAAERGARVSGLDAAEGMVAFARQRLPGGDFRVGDLEQLPFETDAFDAVFAASSIQYTGDRVAALRELARVCRPEGRIVAGLWGPPEKVEYRSILAAMRDALPEPPAGAGPFELSGPGRLESLFEQAGLTLLGGGEVDCPFIYSDFDHFWHANLSGGPWQAALRQIGAEALKAAVKPASEPFRQDGGNIVIQPNVFKYVLATP